MRELLDVVEFAEKEILIMVPYLGEADLEFLKEPFEDAVERGVRVIVAWDGGRTVLENRRATKQWMEKFKDATLPSGLPGVFFVWCGDHHRLEVIVDQERYMTSSFDPKWRIPCAAALLAFDEDAAREARECFKTLVASTLENDWRYYLESMDELRSAIPASIFGRISSCSTKPKRQ